MLTWREDLHETHLKLTFYWRISPDRDSMNQESCMCLNNNNTKKTVCLFITCPGWVCGPASSSRCLWSVVHLDSRTASAWWTTECGTRLAPLRLWCYWQDPSGTCLCTGHPGETQLVTTLWECYMWKVQYTTERRALLLSFWWCLSLRFLISWICHSWPGGHSVLMNVSWQREQLLLLLWVIAVYFIY